VQVKPGTTDPSKLPAAGTYKFTPGPPGSPATVDVKDGSGNLVFTLQTKKAITVVTISDVDATAKTFSLTAVWNRGVAISTGNPQDLQKLTSEVVFTGPGGGALSVPASGATVLAGGADGPASTSASGVLFTSS
jgi:hypothetical protein